MIATAPRVENIKRHAGIAGQFSVTADVTYANEPTERIEFVGSSYGGPVVMVTPNGTQLFVTDSERFGTFGEEWVRRFFAPRDAGSASPLMLASFLPVVLVVIFLAHLAGVVSAAVAS